MVKEVDPTKITLWDGMENRTALGDALHNNTLEMIKSAPNVKHGIPPSRPALSLEKISEKITKIERLLAATDKDRGTEEPAKFLDQHSIPYVTTDEGYLLVDGDVNLSGRGLTEVHLRGVIINGHLDISYNAITHLGMFAHEIRGSLNYRGNPTTMASLRTYGQALVLGNVYVDVPPTSVKINKIIDVNPNWEKHMDALRIEGALQVREKSPLQYRMESWLSAGRRLLSRVFTPAPAMQPALADSRVERATGLMLGADTADQVAFLRELRHEFADIEERRVAERFEQERSALERTAELQIDQRRQIDTAVARLGGLRDRAATEVRYLETTHGSQIDNLLSPLPDKPSLPPPKPAGSGHK